jgi:hypothetical protein
MGRQLAVVAYWNTLKCTAAKKNRRKRLLEEEEEEVLLPFLRSCFA